MVKISPIYTRKELKEFIKFKINLYKKNPYAVPPLYADEIDTLLKGKNPALDLYDHQVFVARRDDKIVGRIVAIINHVSNQKEETQYVRFGFVDFIDDSEVVDALIGAVEQWGHERGMTEIHGPLGFTDFDPEGMLIKGFEELSTIVGIYNYPYYPIHLERLGFKEAARWVEYKITTPEKVPDKYLRIAEIVKEKYHPRIIKIKNSREFIKKGYGQKLFKLINISYDHLYGYSKLNDKMIEYYINRYIPLLRYELITLIVDNKDELVALGVTLPSLSKAMQKANGKMFPFGFIHLLKALKWKKAEICDLMLIASHPDLKNQGFAALLFTDLIPQFNKLGAKFLETNPELENNTRVQALWSDFEKVQHKSRVVYTKGIV